uniref:Uncharacterized protein n=1 Tax=Acrobeloides nanus TaxID=290746 RepID=A0A914E030_9BILA
MISSNYVSKSIVFGIMISLLTIGLIAKEEPNNSKQDSSNSDAVLTKDRIFFIGLYVYMNVIGLMAFYQIRIPQAATIQLCMTFAMIWMIFMVPVSQIRPPLGNDRAAACWLDIMNKFAI